MNFCRTEVFLLIKIELFPPLFKFLFLSQPIVVASVNVALLFSSSDLSLDTSSSPLPLFFFFVAFGGAPSTWRVSATVESSSSLCPSWPALPFLHPLARYLNSVLLEHDHAAPTRFRNDPTHLVSLRPICVRGSADSQTSPLSPFYVGPIRTTIPRRLCNLATPAVSVSALCRLRLELDFFRASFILLSPSFRDFSTSTF